MRRPGGRSTKASDVVKAMTPVIQVRTGPLYTILAFVIAPLVPSVTLSGFSQGATDFGSLLFAMLAFYVFSFVLTLPIALPLYLLLQRFGLVRWWSAALGGFLAGQGVVVLLFGNVGATGYLGFGTVGCLAGVVFWLIWRHGHHPAQPDPPEDAPSASS